MGSMANGKKGLTEAQDISDAVLCPSDEAVADGAEPRFHRGRQRKVWRSVAVAVVDAVAVAGADAVVAAAVKPGEVGVPDWEAGNVGARPLLDEGGAAGGPPKRRGNTRSYTRTQGMAGEGATSPNIFPVSTRSQKSVRRPRLQWEGSESAK